MLSQVLSIAWTFSAQLISERGGIWIDMKVSWGQISSICGDHACLLWGSRYPSLGWWLQTTHFLVAGGWHCLMWSCGSILVLWRGCLWVDAPWWHLSSEGKEPFFLKGYLIWRNGGGQRTELYGVAYWDNCEDYGVCCDPVPCKQEGCELFDMCRKKSWADLVNYQVKDCLLFLSSPKRRGEVVVRIVVRKGGMRMAFGTSDGLPALPLSSASSRWSIVSLGVVRACRVHLFLMVIEELFSLVIE